MSPGTLTALRSLYTVPICALFLCALVLVGCGGEGTSGLLNDLDRDDAGGDAPVLDGSDEVEASMPDVIDGDAPEAEPDVAVDVQEDAPDEGADAQDDVESDGEAGGGNLPPVAVLELKEPYPGSRNVTLDGQKSVDPNPGDTIVQYKWSWAGQSVVTIEPKLTVIVPCDEPEVTFHLVVTDNHAAQSAPTSETAHLDVTHGPWVSVDDCVPSDECGTTERPWCSITAGFEARRAHGEISLNVVKGRYVQGTTQMGGETIAPPGETLDWQIDAGESMEVHAYDHVGSYSELNAASCDAWATSPEGVVVVTGASDGWSIEGDGSVTLQKLCVVGRPVTLPPPSTFRALSLRSDWAVLTDCIVRTDTVPPPLPEESVAVFCGRGRCWLDGDITVGSAGTKAVGFQAVGGTSVDDKPRPSLSYGQIAFAEDAAAVETIGLEIVNGLYIDLEDMTIDGGPGEQSTGISVVGLHNDGAILYTTAFGRGSRSSIGLRAQDVPYAVTARYNHFRGHAPTSQPTQVQTATGVLLINAAVDLLDCEVEGTGQGVTATDAARGVHINGFQNSIYFYLGTVRGGDALHLAVGLDVESAPKLIVMNQTIAGGSVQGPKPTEPNVQSLAAGIRLHGEGGEVDLGTLTLRGCDPACVDHGVALEDPGSENALSLLGAGLFVDNDAGTANVPTAWIVSLIDSVDAAGGRVVKTYDVLPSQAELVGLLAVGGYANGHDITAEPGSRFFGSLDPSARPSRAAGIHLVRSSLTLEDPGEIDGGPAEDTARGIWLTDAHAAGGSPPASPAFLSVSGTGAPLLISGNASDALEGRPRHAFGIQDSSNADASIANWVRLVGSLPSAGQAWSTVQGGRATSDSQGSAIGASLSGTADVHVERVRVNGGVAPGGVQRGVELRDLREVVETPTIDACLIEACGYVFGTQPASECMQTLSEPSEGVHASGGTVDPYWPLVFSNNLVFGGWSSNGPEQASIALACAVDDPSGGTLPTARHFLHNLFSGQGTTPAGGCDSAPASRSEGIRLFLEQGAAAEIVTSSVVAFSNNLIHDGGLACERFAVVEDIAGADLQGIAFLSNDFMPPLPGRDLTSSGTFVALREAHLPASLDHCVLGASPGWPECLATIASGSYGSTLRVDPGFVAVAASMLIDVPSLVPVGEFGASDAALAGVPGGVDHDLLGEVRNPTTPTIGPVEQVSGQ